MSKLTEIEVSHKIDRFFKDEIDVVGFSLCMRRFMHAVVRLDFEKNDDNLYREELEKAHYWLHNFVETIDPYLEKEN